MAKRTPSPLHASESKPPPHSQELSAMSAMYTQAQQNEFWTLYARIAQPAIERACRAGARALTDHAMSAEDMVAWVDDRVWRMLREAGVGGEGGWPVFHDGPTPADAAQRLAEKSKLLARWAYLALSRKTWRRKAREAKYLKGMSRVERLAAVEPAEVDFEHFEQVQADLERIRDSVSDKARANMAASWQDPEDRRRIAAALGATDAAADALIARAEAGEIKANTLDQMRSRSRREVRSALGRTIGRVLVLAVGIGAMLLATAPTVAGEQTGGRPGVRPEASRDAGAYAGEQTGGRPG